LGAVSSFSVHHIPWWPAGDCPSDPVKGRPLEALTDHELVCAFYYVVWHERLNAAEIVFIPPLALLVLGSLIIWVAPGFSAGSKKGV
jgi:hypothetical protein